MKLYEHMRWWVNAVDLPVFDTVEMGKIFIIIVPFAYVIVINTELWFACGQFCFFIPEVNEWNI